MDWTNIVRWIHILAGVSWIGEVIVINVVLVPAVARFEGEVRARVLIEIFPRIFKLASWLASIALIAGLVLLWTRFSGHWAEMASSSRGMATLTGAGLATLLAGFHFILEPRLEGMICKTGELPEGPLADKVMWSLRLIPRVGLGVITLIAVLMMYGARGL